MGSARAAKDWAGKFLLFFHKYFSSLLVCFWDSIWFRVSQSFSYFPLVLFYFFFKSNLVNSNVHLSCQVHSLVICDGFQSSWWKTVYKSCYFNCVTRGMPSLSWWHAFSFWILFLSQAPNSVPGTLAEQVKRAACGWLRFHMKYRAAQFCRSEKCCDSAYCQNLLLFLNPPEMLLIKRAVPCPSLSPWFMLEPWVWFGSLKFWELCKCPI